MNAADTKLTAGTVFSARLIEQSATIEGVGCRAKRRRNLGALPIEPVSGSSVIRRRLLSSASGEGGRRAYQDHSYHTVSNLGLAVDHFKRSAPRACAGSTGASQQRPRPHAQPAVQCTLNRLGRLKSWAM
jgi:hypothetical protein